MTAILQADGPAGLAPAVGTVLVRPTLDDADWVVELRGFTAMLRTTRPRYGKMSHARGTIGWLKDGVAAAEGVAEEHDLAIDWSGYHATAEPSELPVATGIWRAR